MKKTIIKIIISIVLLFTSAFSFWMLVDTNLQLSGTKDNLERIKLLTNNEPKNLKLKETELAKESKKYLITTSTSTILFSIVVATFLYKYEQKASKE